MCFQHQAGFQCLEHNMIDVYLERTLLHFVSLSRLVGALKNIRQYAGSRDIASRTRSLDN